MLLRIIFPTLLYKQNIIRKERAPLSIFLHTTFGFDRYLSDNFTTYFTHVTRQNL